MYLKYTVEGFLNSVINGQIRSLSKNDQKIIDCLLQCVFRLLSAVFLGGRHVGEPRFGGVHRLGLVDEILFDIKSGLVWSDILRKHQNKSQIYEAYQIFSRKIAEKSENVKDDLVEAQTILEDRV
jgi:hypothetical protein